MHVTANLALRHLAGLRWIWLHPGLLPTAGGYIPTQYYPLLHTSFWIDYHLWGLDPRGYHAISVLLQVAVSLLVWRVLRRLEMPGALLAAAVFALHPVQVESVAWISERKNLLSGLFSLAAALAYFRFLPAGAGAGERPKSRLHPGSALVPARPPQQDGDRLAADRAGARALVETRTTGTPRTALPPGHAPGRVEHRPGDGCHRVDGGRGQGSRVRFHAGRPAPDRRTRPLVLPREARLARRAGLRLSVVGDRHLGPLAIRLSSGGDPGPSRRLAVSSGVGPGPALCDVVLRGHPVACARLPGLLHDALHLRGRPLSVPGEPRPDRTGERGRDRPPGPAAATPRRRGPRCRAAGRSRRIVLSPRPRVPQQRRTLAGHAGQEPPLLDGPEQPRGGPDGREPSGGSAGAPGTRDRDPGPTTRTPG